MSKKRIRAVLGWNGDPVRHPKCAAWILPATADAYEGMVEQMCEAINGPYLDWKPKDKAELYGDKARAALRAIGIKPPKKGTP